VQVRECVSDSPGVASSPAMLSISPCRMRLINDPILELLGQLHRIILVTQVAILSLESHASHLSLISVLVSAAAADYSAASSRDGQSINQSINQFIC